MSLARQIKRVLFSKMQKQKKTHDYQIINEFNFSYIVLTILINHYEYHLSIQPNMFAAKVINRAT